ncbi:NADH-quinone oxidoreductase subunit N [Microbulbifer sp. SAOS-129_SWC]|uniref:NADH-quinone oxidoreductase subunit N n=1 Tax=Microbulbifer sp. SAOS-129_SWC TaxID=3145235 RepID=UPI0032168091
MSLSELRAITPLLFLGAGIVLLMLQVSFVRGHRAALLTTLVTIAAAGYGCFVAVAGLPPGSGAVAVTELLAVDRTALFVCLLLLLAAAAIAVLGFSYLKPRCQRVRGAASYPEEFYILLLLTMLGACTLTFACHFASFFLSLELVSLALYPMLGFAVIGERSPRRDQLHSLEAGIKYLLLSALSTALGLFGIAVIYAACGALDFAGVAAALGNGEGLSLLLVGLTLLLAAIAFKLSLVPFHIWTPDVYEGAPTPVTALIATVGKGAVVALLLRLFSQLELLVIPILTTLLATMAVASMLVGNLLALQQSNVKRLLAYSSIAHLGYLIVAFLIGKSAFGTEAVIYYLVAYVVTTLGAFAVVGLIADDAFRKAQGGADSPPKTTLSRQPLPRDPFDREYYSGLFWRSPWLACCLAAMLLSLAGIPLTIGFIGKFYIFAAGVQGQLWLLLAAVIIGSALGLYYYLGLLLTMAQRDNGETEAVTGEVQVAKSGHAVLVLLTAALLGFGVFPQVLINWINAL